MRTMSRSLPTRSLPARRLMALALVAVLGVSACGSSSGGAAGSSDTTAAAGSDTTAAAAADTTAKASSGGSDEALGDAMVAAFKAVEKGDCAKAKTIGDSLDASAAFTGQDGGKQMENVADAMDKLASSGPSKLRADFAVMAKAFGTLAEAFEELGLGDPEKMAEVMKDPAKAQKLTELGTLMDGTEFTASSDNIAAWMDEKCPGLDNS
jgi:hypothetical protein